MADTTGMRRRMSDMGQRLRFQGIADNQEEARQHCYELIKKAPSIKAGFIFGHGCEQGHKHMHGHGHGHEHGRMRHHHSDDHIVYNRDRSHSHLPAASDAAVCV
jgi:hypothetical protein